MTTKDLPIAYTTTEANDYIIILQPDNTSTTGFRTRRILEQTLLAVLSGGSTLPTNFNADIAPVPPSSYDDEFSGNTLSAKWTVAHAGTATIVIAQDRLQMQIATNASEEVTAITQPISGNFTVFTKSYIPLIQANYNFQGIYAGNSASGKFLTFWNGFHSGYGSDGVFNLMRFTDFTTQSGATVVGANYGRRDFVYQKLVNDGTNLKFYLSNDGLIYFLVATEALSSFVTAVDRIGLCGMTYNASTGNNLSFEFFRHI